MSGDIRPSHSGNESKIRVSAPARFTETPSEPTQADPVTASRFSLNPFSPEAFDRKFYAFEVKGELSLSSFFGPWHTVTLNGHPEVEVPWTDSYLLAEWESFLLGAGANREVDRWSGDSRVTYSWKGKKLIVLSHTEEFLTFEFFDSSGKKSHVRKLTKPLRPPLRVVPPKPGKNSSEYTLTIHGWDFKVIAIFPEDYDDEEKRETLKDIGEALQRLPQRRIGRYASSVGAEVPIKIIITTKEKAKELKFYLHGAGGLYFSDQNHGWIDLEAEDHAFRRTTLHEIAGHGDDDIRAPDDNPAYMTDSQRSALADYYVWKLRRCLSSEELATYAKASEIYRNRLRDPEASSFDLKILENDLDPFREKISRCFVSPYAVEGSRGIPSQLRAPREDYAEVVENFFEVLAGENGKVHEPLFTLLGLDYLMDQYRVDSIGQIQQGEIFSKESFETVLGIHLAFGEEVVAEVAEGGEELSGGRWIRNRTGIVGTVRLGIGVARQDMTDQDSLEKEAVRIEALPGYRWNHFSAGLVMAQNFFGGHSEESRSDIGLWSQLLKEKGSFAFFLETEGGVGWAQSEDEEDSAAYWLGGGAGLMFQGFASLTAQGRLVQGEDDLQGEVGAMIGLDLYHLLNRLGGIGK
ncbi:MAG: hypothetical protein HYT76_07820 [Deltaproteobacteria bacterium]|nr:hypothetical protein [Deltaproteobacteria bacterium]